MKLAETVQNSQQDGTKLHLPTKLGNRYGQYIFENRLKIGFYLPTYLVIRAGHENSNSTGAQDRPVALSQRSKVLCCEASFAVAHCACGRSKFALIAKYQL